MSRLTKNYEFYLERLDEDSLLEFIDSAFDYDFVDYEYDMSIMAQAYLNFQEDVDFVEINSNGSGGGETTYKIGPNGSLLTSYFENKQRGSRKDRLIVNFRSDFYQTERFANYENSIFTDLSSEKGAEYLIKCLEERGPLVLESFPSTIMAMTCHDSLVDYFYRNQTKIFSSCWDPFFDREKIKVRDRMIDWKTGVNFYECSEGALHVVPIWFEEKGMVHNLLNLTKVSFEMSDIMSIKSFKRCICGKTSCEYEFVSHFKQRPKVEGKYIVDLNLAGELKTKMLNVQFVQLENESFNVYYNTFDPFPDKASIDSDRDRIEAFLGRRPEYFPYRSYIVGTYKYPTFWRGFYKTNVVDNICTII